MPADTGSRLPSPPTARMMSPPGAQTAMTTDSIFERIGGATAVSRLVIDFYERVLDDERLAPYFAHANMRRLVEHQAKFMSAVMGGPASYTDRDLGDIHAHLGIDRAAFEAMVGLFAATVAARIPDPADAAAVIEAVRRREPAIVNA